MCTYVNMFNLFFQVTAVMKYWHGGPDPLDFISMYPNPGSIEQGIPPHWHYVSFGLSDLYGDRRVHESSMPDGPSGYGFELSFRLKKDGELNPPTWPAALMQALARYVFQSENTLCMGDHIPWSTSLDGSESRIQHMLMAEDPQMPPINTQFGSVNFVQIVGACAEELKAAQHWNGMGVLDLLKTLSVAGGQWLITDMRRGENMFEIEPALQEQVDDGIEKDGSNLTGVTSKCSWEEPGDRRASISSRQDDDKENYFVPKDKELKRNESEERPRITDFETDQIKATLEKGLINSRPVLPPIRADLKTAHNPLGSRKESFDSNASSDATTEMIRTRTLEKVHLKFNLEAATLLPLALRGRLKHGRHFTFKSIINDIAITLVSSQVVGSIADENTPYACHGPWLQVLLTDEFIDKMLGDLKELSDTDDITVPRCYEWNERGLVITVVPDEV